VALEYETKPPKWEIPISGFSSLPNATPNPQNVILNSHRLDPKLININ